LRVNFYCKPGQLCGDLELEFESEFTSSERQPGFATTLHQPASEILRARFTLDYDKATGRWSGVGKINRELKGNLCRVTQITSSWDVSATLLVQEGILGDPPTLELTFGPMADQGYVVACPGAPPSNYPFVIGSEKTVVSGWNYVDLDNPEIVAEKSHAFEKGYQTIKIHRRFSK
jgi:hypothetical protein